MGTTTEDGRSGRNVDEQGMFQMHQHRLGVLRGQFSKDFAEIDAYQKHVLKEINSIGAPQWNPEVVALGNTIARNAFVRMYVEQMLEEVPKRLQHFRSIEMMLKAINYVVHTAPIYKDPESIAWQFPLSSLMNFWMMTPSGKTVLRMPQMNNHINRIMKAWCVFLNSKESLYVLNNSAEGWLGEKAIKYNQLDDYKAPDRSAPHWGFQCYNEFFHRDIKEQCRPVDAPGDPAVINSPNDGVAWALQYDVKATDSFWLKSQAYSLNDMLNNSPFVERFIGGVVYGSYVNGGADWHRFVSPINGTVVGAEIITGYAWTESDTTPPDPTSGTYSQGWAAGVATRGLVFIDSGIDPIGMVCVIPIGLTEVSSLECFVKEGDSVKKGDQLGWFSFGGSSFAMVFQPGAIKEILVTPPPVGRNHQPKDTLRANKRFAIADIG